MFIDVSDGGMIKLFGPVSVACNHTRRSSTLKGTIFDFDAPFIFVAIFARFRSGGTLLHRIDKPRLKFFIKYLKYFFQITLGVEKSNEGGNSFNFGSFLGFGFLRIVFVCVATLFARVSKSSSLTCVATVTEWLVSFSSN